MMSQSHAVSGGEEYFRLHPKNEIHNNEILV